MASVIKWEKLLGEICSTAENDSGLSDLHF